MPARKHTTEQIIAKLREAEVEIPKGATIPAAHCAGTAETLGDAGLLCKERHSAAMAEAVELMWRDEGLRKALIERGKTKAKDFAKESLPPILNDALG